MPLKLAPIAGVIACLCLVCEALSDLGLVDGGEASFTMVVVASPGCMLGLCSTHSDKKLLNCKLSETVGRLRVSETLITITNV